MGKDIQFDKKRHAFVMLDRLDNMRNDESRSNFKVKVDGDMILAQRDVLIAASDYFDAMLSHDTKENQRGEVEMKDVDFECVKICIDFIYGREISVSQEKYKDLMFVAHMMQLNILCEAIEELMVENLNLKYFFKFKKISELFECPLLQEKCKEFAEENFEAISKESDFDEIDKGYLLSLIEPENISISELEKVEFSFQWVKHDVSRKSHLESLLKRVGLDEIPIGHRRYLMENERLIREDFGIYQLFSTSIMNSAEIPLEDPKEQPNTILILDNNLEYLRAFDPETNEVTETRIQKCDVQEEYSVIVLEDHIYLLAEDKSVHRLKYSKKSSTWKRMADMIDEHGSYPPAVIVSDQIYVVGGRGAMSTSVIEKYNPDRDEWEKVGEKSKSSDGSEVVELEECIYSLGGKVDGQISEEVEMLDVTTSEWTTLAPMNEERAFAAAIVCNDIIIIAGGENNKNEDLKSVEYYDVEDDQWTTLAEMNVERWRFNLVAVDEEIFALGGLNNDNARATIEKYDGENEEWAIVELPGDTNLEIDAAIFVEAQNFCRVL